MGLPLRKLPNHEWEQGTEPLARPGLKLVEKPAAPMFAPLERKPNWRSLGTSGLVHISMVILLILIPLFITEQIAMKRRYDSIELLKAKPVEPYKVRMPKVKLPPPPPLPRLKELPPPPPKQVKIEPPKVVEPPKVEAKVEPPKIEKTPVIPPAPMAPKKVEKTDFDAKLAEPGPKHDKPAIRTDNFGGSSAAPTLPAMDPKKVQTGGFGDPMGVAPGKGDPKKGVQIATFGDPSLPSGPGYGNGGGGDRGARGVIPSAGFGNGIATAGGGGSTVGGNGRGGKVQSGGFSDATAPVAATAKAQARAAEPAATPVEITFKPKPVYTDEARRMKVEGEVLLEVTFLASGQINVLGVKRRLGHGLDEAAVHAAQQIRFKPARTREGTPVDSNAVVHILFELAY